MAWLYLIIAGLLEVVWATAMKYSEGFTKLWPSVLTIGAMILSFGLLSLSMRELPLGTAYGIWTGIGAVGAVIVGLIFLGEPATLQRLFFVALILTGLVGLKLSSSH